MSHSLHEIADTVRSFALYTIANAHSGHPGIASDASEIGVALFHTALRFAPSDPDWIDRDRLVFSAGHASALLYTLLYLYGIGIEKGDLLAFRKHGSKAPGHPEFGVTYGVEATTGPLGEGFASAVGMAIAESVLAQRFNCEGEQPIINHRTFVLVGDGDLMEGVSHEAASLAGHLALGKLVVVWDRNEQTSSGPLRSTSSDDVCRRFESYGWATVDVDGHEISALASELEHPKGRLERPTFIAARTIGGKHLPSVEGTHAAHAAAISIEDALRVASALGIERVEALEPSKRVASAIAERRAQLSANHEAWCARLHTYRIQHPQLCEALTRGRRFEVRDFSDWIANCSKQLKAIPTREANQLVVRDLFDRIPEVFGASIDSTKDFSTPHGVYSARNRGGRNLNCGVREHAMGALLNGISYHGGIRPFGSCFLSFVDHLRPSLRLAAMARLPIVLCATHDSVLIGEDGPTHQPVEQLASLRAMPNLVVYRPADVAETAAAWAFALSNDCPVVMALAKIACTPIAHFEPAHDYAGVHRGGYRVGARRTNPQLIMIATGSEVQIGLEARARLEARGLSVNFISMPSTDVFVEQEISYREDLLEYGSRPILILEAATRFGWDTIVRHPLAMMGVESFGASGSSASIARAFGMDAENVEHRAISILEEWRGRTS